LCWPSTALESDCQTRQQLGAEAQSTTGKPERYTQHAPKQRTEPPRFTKRESSSRGLMMTTNFPGVSLFPGGKRPKAAAHTAVSRRTKGDVRQGNFPVVLQSNIAEWIMPNKEEASCSTLLCIWTERKNGWHGPSKECSQEGFRVTLAKGAVVRHRTVCLASRAVDELATFAGLRLLLQELFDLRVRCSFGVYQWCWCWCWRWCWCRC